MITVTVRYHNMLRRHTGLAEEQVKLPEGTEVDTAIRHVADLHGSRFAEMLLSPSGGLASHLVVFVNEELLLPEGKSSRTSRGPARPLADGDEIKLFPAISGG
jgi:molybdopterin converting factor small subunit